MIYVESLGCSCSILELTVRDLSWEKNYPKLDERKFFKRNAKEQETVNRHKTTAQRSGARTRTRS